MARRVAPAGRRPYSTGGIPGSGTLSPRCRSKGTKLRKSSGTRGKSSGTR